MAAVSPPRDTLLGGGRGPLTVGLVLGVTMIAVEALAVATAMPTVADDLGGLSLYGWAFSAFMLGNVVGIVTTGVQADERGPLLPFSVGLVLFAVGLVVAGVAPEMLVVVLGRGLQGLGAGAVFSTLYVAAGLGYPPHLRSRLLALLSSAWVIPGLLGPAIAGAVTEAFGWRYVFLGMVPLPLVVAALAVPGLRPLGADPQAVAESAAAPADRDRRRIRLALVLTGGIAVALTGTGALRGDVPVAGAVALVAGLAIAAPALRGLLPVGTFRALPGIPAAVATRGLANIAFFGVDAFVPLLLDEVRGTRASVAGIPLTAAAVTWASASWWQSRTHRPPRSTAIVGNVAIAVGIGLVMLVLLPDVPYLLAVLAWAIAGAGMGLVFNPTSVVVLNLAPKAEMGTTTSSLQLSDALGVAIGTGVVGAIVGAYEQAGRGPAGALAIGFALQVAVCVVAARTVLGLPTERLDAPNDGATVDDRPA